MSRPLKRTVRRILTFSEEENAELCKEADSLTLDTVSYLRMLIQLGRKSFTVASKLKPPKSQ